jgi:hypothetical protein
MAWGITTWYLGPTLTFTPIRPPIDWLYQMTISLYRIVNEKLRQGRHWVTASKLDFQILLGEAFGLLKEKISSHPSLSKRRIREG